LPCDPFLLHKVGYPPQDTAKEASPKAEQMGPHDLALSASRNESYINLFSLYISSFRYFVTAKDNT
jgi:hypothetical protein